MSVEYIEPPLYKVHCCERVTQTEPLFIMKGCPSWKFIVDCAAIVSNLFLLIETLHSIALQCKIEYPSPLQAYYKRSLVYLVIQSFIS